MQRPLLESDIDDLVLPLLEILDPLELVDVYPQQTLLKGQVGEELEYLGEDDIAAAEDRLVEFVPHFVVRQSVEGLVHPPLLLLVLPLHVQILLLLIDGPQPFTQFLVEIDDEFAQTVLLDIGDLFIHPILCLNRGLHVLKVPKIGLELGHLPANIALGEDELIILIRFLLGSLLVLLFFVNFLTVFGAAAREDGTEQLPFGLSCGRLELLVQLHELLEFGLNFADIQLFLHLNVAQLQLLARMEHIKASSIGVLLRTMVQNITSQQPFLQLMDHLVEIGQDQGQGPENADMSNNGRNRSHQPRKIEEAVSLVQHISEKLDYEIGAAQVGTEQAAALQTMGKSEVAAQLRGPAEQKAIKFIPLQNPPSIQPHIYQHHSLKEQPFENKANIRQSSEESSINLQLTLKTKQTKNNSNTLARQDSLIYSDATLIYSNATGFGYENHNNLAQRAQRSQSHKSALRQVEDGDQNDISARMERAVSRQVQRNLNSEETTSNKQPQMNLPSEYKEQAIFQTEVDDYKSKIAKIREIKQKKKKQLQNELNRVTRQIDELVRKQPPQIIKSSNFESRVKIADNAVAQVKAERLVKGLQRQKKARHEAHLDELHVIDKNINHYMEELMKERYKNQERIKQKKKLDIIERMKHQEMRKIQEQRQKELNIRFVSKLKASGSRPQIQQKLVLQPQPIKQNLKSEVQNKQRSPTKITDGGQESEVTPELSRKKAYLKKIRNISFKKEKVDAYEQLLM